MELEKIQKLYNRTWTEESEIQDHLEAELEDMLDDQTPDQIKEEIKDLDDKEFRQYALNVFDDFYAEQDQS